MPVYLTFIALLIVIGTLYIPVKRSLENFLQQQHEKTVASLRDVEQKCNNEQGNYKKLKQCFEKNIKSNETKLFNFKKDLQDAHKVKILQLNKIAEHDLDMLLTLHQKDIVELSDSLVRQQIKGSIKAVLEDLQKKERQQSFMEKKLHQIN